MRVTRGSSVAVGIALAAVSIVASASSKPGAVSSALSISAASIPTQGAGAHWIGKGHALPALISLPLPVQGQGGGQQPKTMSTQNTGNMNAPHCSAGGGSTTGGLSCSVDENSTGSCSAMGGGYSCSAQAGGGSAGTGFCSASSGGTGGHATCSVQGGNDSHCSAARSGSGDGGAQCSASGGAQCSAAGSNGQDGNSCSAFNTGVSPGEGEGASTCSSYSAGSFCSVTTGSQGTGGATCTAYGGGLPEGACSAQGGLGECSIKDSQTGGVSGPPCSN